MLNPEEVHPFVDELVICFASKSDTGRYLDKGAR
jgi:hypothetical protein